MKKINLMLIALIIVFVFSSCGCDKSQQIVIQTSASSSYFETTTQTTTKIKNKKYVKSINSNKFHSTDCFWVQKILDKNKIYSKTRKYFIDCGYSPCEECRP